MDELRFKSDVFNKTGVVAVLNGDVVKADRSLAEDLRIELFEAARPLLENVHPRDRDYRHGSGERVIDLVNPAHYPLIVSRSRAIRTRSPPIGLDDWYTRFNDALPLQLGSLFQWAPFEVSLSSGKAQ